MNKGEIGTVDYFKIKNFYAGNYTTRKVKIQAIEQEKIFANHIFDKGLTSRLYKGTLMTKQ